MYRGVSYNAEEDLRNTETPCTVRLLRANNVQDGEIVFDDIQIIDRKCVKETQLLQTGDILVCMANGSRDLVGKAAQFNDKERLYTFGAFMGCFRTKNVNDSNYISYLLQSTKYRKYITILLAGSSINNLRPSDIESMEFQFPTDAERQMIVSCLQDVDKQISSTQHLLTKYESIKKATVKKLMTPTRNWQTTTIENIANVVTGATPTTSIPEYWDNPTIPWMSSGEIKNRFITSTNNRISQLGYDRTSTHLIKPNSVLIALAGQGTTRGKVAINRIELCTNQSLAAITPFRPEDYGYIFWNLNSRYNELRSISTGDGGRGGLNLHLIKALPIQLPDEILRDSISTQLFSIAQLEDKLHNRIIKLKDIKQSMLQYYFD